MTETLMTSGEVADLARVTRQAVAGWVAKGLLIPAMELPGGSKRFRRSDVEAFLAPKSERVEASA